MSLMIFLHESLKFSDSIELFFHIIDFECLKRFDWLADVYNFWQDGKISSNEAITAARWVLDNLCYANV